MKKTVLYRTKELPTMYQADSTRYDSMLYRRCGASGLKLPAVSLGLWHNFGDTASYANMKEICCTNSAYQTQPYG